MVAKGDKQKKLQVEKLEENFKDAINRYHTLQKVNYFTYSYLCFINNFLQELATKQKAHLLISASIESEVAQEDDQNQQQQQALAREMAFEHDMMVEREARIMQIEADVLDINQIMRELGSLVHEQGETIGNTFNLITKKKNKICCKSLLVTLFLIFFFFRYN